MSSAKAHYDGIKAFSETDFTDDLRAITVPTLVIGGQSDTVVTPSYLSGLYATMPGSTQSGFAQIAGEVAEEMEAPFRRPFFAHEQHRDRRA